MALTTSERNHLGAKMRGWEWVVPEMHRVAEECCAEATRLLGPERGE